MTWLRVRRILSAADAEFHAVQRVPAVPLHRAAYYLLYFHCKHHGSTLTMRLRGLTVDAVRQHIETSRKKFL